VDHAVTTPVIDVAALLGGAERPSEAVVRRYAAAFNQRDLSSVLALCDDLVETPCFRGTGHTAIRAGLQDLWRATPGVVAHPVDVLLGDAVLWLCVDFGPGADDRMTPLGVTVLGEGDGAITFLDHPLGPEISALVRHRLAGR
jgi:hypothetical protein